MAQVQYPIAKYGYHKIGVAWINPADAFDHVRVIYKAGSAPANDTDGTFVDYAAGSAELSVNYGASIGTGGYFQFDGSDSGTIIYFQIYTYISPSDPSPVGLSTPLQAAPAQGGLSIPVYGGNVKDAAGNPIVPGADTWVVKVVNPKFAPGTTPPGDTFYTIVSENMTDDTFTFDLGTNNISPLTNYAGDLMWHGDTVTIEVYKNGVKQFSVPQFVNLYQATNATASVPGGASNPDLLQHLILQQPSNVLPVAPEIVPGQDTSTSDVTPTVMWYHRADSDNPNSEIHYAVEFSQAQVDVGGGVMQVDDTHASYRVFLSVDNPEYFEFTSDGGTNWALFTTLGGAGLVLAENANNICRITIPDEVGKKLDVGQWYWQVRATDKTPV